MKIGKARKQKGFTIIELVVVILLLGILTATALPRFMDVTAKAHEAAVSGTLGGLSTGVALFRAQWVANGQPSGAISGFGDGTQVANATGYPAGKGDGTIDTDEECVDVWNGVLQGGRPTIVALGDETAPNASEVSGATTDWLAWSGSAGTGSDTCSYAYVLEGVSPLPTITYNSSSGEVALLTGGTTVL